LAPTGFLGQFIVGQDIGPLLGLRQAAGEECRDLCHAQQLGSLQPAMAGQHHAGFVDQDGVEKTKGAGVAGIECQGADGAEGLASTSAAKLSLASNAEASGSS